MRRAGGGRRYQAHADGVTPWHSAMAATYAHATAPLRRLADRYVVEASLSIARGEPVAPEVEAAFAELPAAMATAESRARGVDAAVLDLAEAALLAGHEGEVFDAVVLDEDRRGAVIQLRDPRCWRACTPTASIPATRSACSSTVSTSPPAASISPAWGDSLFRFATRGCEARSMERPAAAPIPAGDRPA